MRLKRPPHEVRSITVDAPKRMLEMYFAKYLSLLTDGMMFSKATEVILTIEYF